MPQSLSRPLLLAPLLGLLGASCVPEPGSSGPERATPGEATGPCFEADLTDGFQDGQEILTVFSCFNSYGALDELEPLVTYLATSDEAETLVQASNETIETFDVVGGLEILARLLDAEDEPLSRAAGLFVEAMDHGLVSPGIGVAREASDAMVACEALDNRAECSVPRLALHLLDTELPDDLGTIVDAMDAGLEREQTEPLLEDVAQLLVLTSSANTDKPTAGNDLLAFGRFLVDDHAGEGAPLEQLLPHVAGLLDDDLDDDGDLDQNPDDDNLLAALARPIAGLWRDGAIQGVPAEVAYIFQHNMAGEDVGWYGTNLLDELLLATEDLTGDPDLLEMEITLPGESEPTTLIELVLDTLDTLYLNGADPAEVVAQLEETLDLICEGEASNAICDLAGDAVPPLAALVENAPNLTTSALALAYALHQTTDVTDLLDLVFLALELDLLDEADPVLVATLQTGLLDDALVVVPVFIDTDLGRLRPAARAAQEIGQLLLTESDLDGDGQDTIPALVPLGLLRQLLHPEFPTADLDLLLGVLGQRMLDPESGLYPSTLLDLISSTREALGVVQVDVEVLARRALENEDLWLSAVTLLADPGLADLLAPVQGREGATWYLYELIAGGLLDEVLDLVASLLGMLIDYGLLDPGLEDEPAAARVAAPPRHVPLPAPFPVADAVR